MNIRRLACVTSIGTIMVALPFLSGCVAMGSEGYEVASDGVHFYSYRMQAPLDIIGTKDSRLVIGADPKTFHALSDHWGRDKDHIFFELSTIEGAHPASFVIVEGAIAHDDQHIFVGGRMVAACDAPSFHKFPGTDDWYADSRCVYQLLGLRQLPGADPASFVPITPFYGKDKDHVYYDDSVVQGADPATFGKTCGICIVCGQDKNGCYWNEHPVPCDCSKGHNEGEFAHPYPTPTDAKGLPDGEHFSFGPDPNDGLHWVQVAPEGGDSAERWAFIPGVKNVWAPDQRIVVSDYQTPGPAQLDAVEQLILTGLSKGCTTFATNKRNDGISNGYRRVYEEAFCDGSSPVKSYLSFNQGKQEVYVVVWSVRGQLLAHMLADKMHLWDNSITQYLFLNPQVCEIAQGKTTCNSLHEILK